MASNKRVMTTPYQALYAKKNNRSKPYLMLSELLDNSIASWLDKKQTSDLNIELIINSKKRTISCSDNANGMSPQELLDSVELNKETSGNNINMFGVGMKNAAFWFGHDLKIRTMNGKEASGTKVILSDKLDKLNETIAWSIEKSLSNKKFMGTEIWIENVYADKTPNRREILKLENILETKYRNYLNGTSAEIKSKYKVNISIEFTDKVGNTEYWTLEPKVVNAQLVEEAKKKEAIQKIKDLYKGHKPSRLKRIDKLAIEKIKNNEPLDFLFKLKLPFGKKKEIEFEIGVQSQSADR